MSEKGPEFIGNILMGFQKARTILTAYEIGIFTALGFNSRTSDEVANICGTDIKATDRLMNALCAAEIIEKEDKFFKNSKASSEFLDKKSPSYIEGLGHISHMWNLWSNLTQAVKKGTSFQEKHVNSWDDDQLRSFIAAMHDRAKLQAPVFAKMFDLKKAKRLLDVGGGSGAFTFGFLREKEDLSAVIFDIPEVLPITLEYIKREGLEDRISLTEGDYNKDEPGSGFDIILLSAIIHSNSIEQNQSLINKCSKALNIGGRIIIQDFIMDESRTQPPFGAFFSLNMLVATPSGDTYTEKEIRSWLENAGFVDINLRETPFGTGVICAVKPG